MNTPSPATFRRQLAGEVVSIETARVFRDLDRAIAWAVRRWLIPECLDKPVKRRGRAA